MVCHFRRFRLCNEDFYCLALRFQVDMRVQLQRSALQKPCYSQYESIAGTDMPKPYVIQARWKFRGSWQHLKQEVTAHDMYEAGRVLYSLLPITFFRSQDHAVMIRYPQKQRLELATPGEDAEDQSAGQRVPA